MIAFYDLDICPMSFDVVQFIVAAQYAADGSPVHVVIVPGRRDGWKSTDHKPIDDAEREWRMLRVLGAAFRLAGMTYTIAPTRDFARAFKPLHPFPQHYSVDKPTKAYYLAHALAAVREGGQPSFRASERARQRVEGMFGRDFVTITLRNTHTPARNSNAEAWADAAAQIGASRRVVVIPDTADIGKGGASDLLALDLDMRLAAYELAALNMAASGGPFCLAVFMGLPYVWFHEAARPVDGTGDFHAVPAYMTLMRFPVGSQWPGHGEPNRRTLWEPDTFDNIMAAYDAAIGLRVAA